MASNQGRVARARALYQFRRRFLRAWANDDFEHQARFARQGDVRPMLADLFQVAFLLVGMLLASEAVGFIQFDVAESKRL